MDAASNVRRPSVHLYGIFLSEWKSGSAGRIRTYDQPVNSRLLYH
jgi:hypothetical protein